MVPNNDGMHSSRTVFLGVIFYEMVTGLTFLCGYSAAIH